MKTEYIRYSWDNVKHRKMRSWLTVVSILIGIAAIYALVSFGQGLSSYVDSLSSEVGKDKLILQAKGVGAPGTDKTFSLTREDIEFIGRNKDVIESVGMYVETIQIEFKDVKKFVFGMSLPDDNREKIMLKEAFAFDLDSGRDLKKGDKFKVLLGYNYQLPDKIFKTPIKMREKILLNGRTFEVVGYMQSIGNPQDDSNIYLSEEAMEMLFPEDVDLFSFGIARVDSSADAVEVGERVSEKLRRFKGQEKGKEDFFIQTFGQAIEAFNNVISIINAVLVLIALISLVVAGVNITNTMYTSVLERTKEIGIMKAIGAQNNDIMTIFLLESGILGLVGGVFGIILGYGIASFGGLIAANAGYSFLQPVFPWELTVGCLMFAFLVGSIAGTFPAMRASKLRPVDALRYE